MSAKVDRTLPPSIPSCNSLSEYTNKPYSYLISLHEKITTSCKSIFIPEEEPNVNLALAKTGIALTSLYMTDNFNFDYLSTAREILSLGLLSTGIRELSYLAYSKLTSRPSTRRNKYQNIRVQTNEEKTDNLHRLLKIIKLVSISALSLKCLYSYDSLGNLDFFNDHKFTLTNYYKVFTNKDDHLLQLLQIGACVASLKINFQELSNYKEKKFLRSSPTNEIINTFVLATFFSQINLPTGTLREWLNCMSPVFNGIVETKDPLNFDLTGVEQCRGILEKDQSPETRKKVIEFVDKYLRLLKHTLTSFSEVEQTTSGLLRQHMPKETIKPGDLHLHLAQHYTKYYALLNGTTNICSLLYKNTMNLIETSELIQTEEIESSPSPQKNSPTKYPQALHPQKSPRNQSSTHSSPEIDYYYSENDHSDKYKEESSSPRKEEKLKTKGIPHKNGATATTTTTTTTTLDAQESLDPRENERLEALDRIQEMSFEYPIKEHKLISELGNAAKFLNGSLIPIDGNEYRLVWTVDNIRRTLKYETPHGSDSANFIANKRKRVLNALSTAYLSGLDPELATKYIEDYNLYHLYRLPKLISYIFNEKS